MRNIGKAASHLARTIVHAGPANRPSTPVFGNDGDGFGRVQVGRLRSAVNGRGSTMEVEARIRDRSELRETFRPHDRSEVIMEGAEACAWDRCYTIFYFDGRQFWRHDCRDESLTLVPSWTAPRRGWLHVAGRVCRVCREVEREAGRAA